VTGPRSSAGGAAASAPFTDRGGYVFIQAKLRLRLGRASEVICSSEVHKLPGTA
jgi:hypothetical protein